jgi:hypothetical protein
LRESDTVALAVMERGKQSKNSIFLNLWVYCRSLCSPTLALLVSPATGSWFTVRSAISCGRGTAFDFSGMLKGFVERFLQSYRLAWINKCFLLIPVWFVAQRLYGLVFKWKKYHTS